MAIYVRKQVCQECGEIVQYNSLTGKFKCEMERCCNPAIEEVIRDWIKLED